MKPITPDDIDISEVMASGDFRSQEWLEEMYIDNFFTTGQIANMLGCSERKTVYNWVSQYNMPTTAKGRRELQAERKMTGKNIVSTRKPKTDIDTFSQNTAPKYLFTDKDVAASVKGKKSHPELLDLRDEIALLQTTLQGMVNDTSPRAGKQLDVIAELRRLVVTLHNIEESRKVTLTVENVKLMLEKIVRLIKKKYVTDPERQKELAFDIRSLAGSAKPIGEDIPMVKNENTI